ncbi:MAG TPA: erythromycin esterase family protein [Anaerolineales bacterium]|nr:erythromycin esterase family protein [Anaerolineales bacterium]
MTTQMTFADWIRHHAHVLDSLDPQTPLDDLEPLSELIGDARVVALGESAHYVREFYLLRHRLLRFLAERCGFTVYVMEAPFTEAHTIDKWIQGSPGTAEEVAAAGMAFNMGRRREMYDHLTWMRSHNQTAIIPLRFTGGGLPASGGSPMAALEEVDLYLRQADPDALPLLEQATDLVKQYHSTATFEVLFRYSELDPASQDVLTATLSRLLSRMETTSTYQRRGQRESDYGTALHHLRGVWYLDHFHRQYAGRGIPGEHPHALHDVFMAESVIRLLRNGINNTRIVLAYHNIHIQKTPLLKDGAIAGLPGGYHLAHTLGKDFVAIAVTNCAGHTAQMRPNSEKPLGFEITSVPLPAPADEAVEAVFAGDANPVFVNLRAAHPVISDAGSFQQMRMEDSFMDVPVFDAFDAIISIPHTSVSEDNDSRKEQNE